MSNEINIQENCDDVVFVALGGLSKYEEKIWKFPKINVCPLDECEQSFSNPTNCVEHFCQQHAATAMLCSVCNTIFTAEKLTIHYNNNHPDKAPPKLKSVVDFDMAENSDVEVANDSPNRSYDDDDQTNGEIGLITLKGCGIVTKWNFPANSKTCPKGGCQESFNTRFEAITHYTIHHSMNAIVCHICDRPISTIGRRGQSHYKLHFQRKHPKEKIPFDFATTQNHLNSYSTDDLITLNGCGLETHWQMPLDQSKCPVIRCQQNSFANRSDLITHYKREHSKISVYCCICDKPIIARSRSHFKTHYKLLHPRVSDPFDFEANKNPPRISQQKKIRRGYDNNLINLHAFGYHTKWYFPPNMKNCPVKGCRFSKSKFTTQSAAKMHYKKYHSMNAIVCSICDKPVSTLQLSNYIAHFKRKHKNVENPLDLLKNERISTTAKEKGNRVQRIRTRFSNRIATVTHHNNKTKRSKRFVSCGICDKNMATRHCRSEHPNNKIQLKQPIGQKFKRDIGMKKVSILSNLQIHTNGMQHRPQVQHQKPEHRVIKSQPKLNARRIVLSHRWKRRYYSRIFDKIRHRSNRQIQKVYNTNKINKKAAASEPIPTNVFMENDAAQNDCEFEENLLVPLIINVSGGWSIENTNTESYEINASHVYDDDDDHDETEVTNQMQQSKGQKLAPSEVDLTKDVAVRLSPRPSSPILIDLTEMTIKSEIVNLKDATPETIEVIDDGLSDEKPLDLSMPKPFYILDSDEEAETITIHFDDDDDFDDNKEHLRKSMPKF